LRKEELRGEGRRRGRRMGKRGLAMRIGKEREGKGREKKGRERERVRQDSYLIEENVFPVAAFRCEVLQVPVLVYAMFTAQLLPELTPHCEMHVSRRSRGITHAPALLPPLPFARGIYGRALGFGEETNRYYRIGLLVL
jgi:hypothetical protein